MMIRPVFALFLLFFAAAAPAPGEAEGLVKTAGAKPAIPPALTGQGYRLVKNWDFGITVKTVADLRREFYTRFIYDGGRLDHLKSEWQRYGDDDNHRIEGNTLDLVARLRGGLRDGGIESGMLRSKWTGEYGYYEIRMKVPSGRGLWPAFWLNPQDGRWPPEIDVVEIVNNGRDTTKNSFHNIHPGRPADEAPVTTRLDQWGSYRPDFDYAGGFHTFAVKWTPDRVIHYVDNVPVSERRFVWRHEDGSDAGPAHVLLNLAVGGDWPGPPSDDAEFPARLQVDYIRVWQR
jgi:hypothetical protein